MQDSTNVVLCEEICTKVRNIDTSFRCHILFTSHRCQPCSDGKKFGSLMTNFWSFTVAATKTCKAITFTCLWW